MQFQVNFITNFMNTFSSGFIGSHEKGVLVMGQNGTIDPVCADSDIIEGALTFRNCTFLFPSKF